MSAPTQAAGPNLTQAMHAVVTADADKAGDPARTQSQSQSQSRSPAHPSEQALVPASRVGPAVAITPDGPVARLPVELDVGIPLRDFRVRDLLSLGSGSIVESQWTHGDDVPVAAGKVQLAWSEFEVMDSQLAVRVTRLA